MVAVRVDADVERQRGFVKIQGGKAISVVDGHLYVTDAELTAVAVFAPQKWLAAKVDEDFE